MKKKKSAVKILAVTLVGLAIAAGIGLYGANVWYSNNLKPLSEAVAEQQFEIEDGDSIEAIASQLYDKGLIRNATAFEFYLSRQPSSDLQVGLYRLSPHLSVKDIVTIIVEGQIDTRFTTIIPGLRLAEVVDSLVEQGFNEAEVNAALEATYDHPLFSELPTGADLEGYIFPETIQITSETSVETLLERHFDELYSNISSEMLTGIARQGLSLHEAVILASIVQQEIGDPEIQPMVAQVFLKRLEIGEVLGADATFFYAAETLGVEPSVTLDSPYNTRINGGLPPGPISNFNITALEAVANPSNTDYLFFVSGDDGGTYFAKTEAEHNQNVAEFCFELCKL